MSRTHLDSAPATSASTDRLSAWIPLVIAAVCAASYAVFLALPYYVNDLDRFPLDEVAGGLHDPRDLWPFNQGLAGGLFMLGGYFSMVISPIVAAATAMWAAFHIWHGWAERDVRRTALGILTIVFSAATFAWLASPLGEALVSWMLD